MIKAEVVRTTIIQNKTYEKGNIITLSDVEAYARFRQGCVKLLEYLPLTKK